jgi:thioredoxin-related protein
MRHQCVRAFGVLALAGVLLTGCGDSDTAKDTAQTGETSAAGNKTVGSPKIPPLSPELAAKWREHTLDLPFVVGYEQGKQLAAENGRPAMMFVTTTWCIWCKRLSEGSFHDEDVKRMLSQFVCVIVDGDTEPDALAALGANEGFPHIIFLSADGRQIGECKGYLPLDQFKPIVEAALAQAGG